MKIDNHNYKYTKNDYLGKFNQQLSLKRESNKSEKDKFFMSYKRPIPISNYDYSLFNFLPKVQKEIFINDLYNKNKKTNTRHFYRYLTGKIISDLYWNDFIYLLILDKKDDIIAVSLYHLDKHIIFHHLYIIHVQGLMMVPYHELNLKYLCNHLES